MYENMTTIGSSIEGRPAVQVIKIEIELIKMFYHLTLMINFHEKFVKNTCQNI